MPLRSADILLLMVQPARFPTLTAQLFQLASGSATSDEVA
jgi:hypothetical protein